jgi:DNA-binding GntR family transcriptional regulator
MSSVDSLGPAAAAMVPPLDEGQFAQRMTVRAGLEPVAAAAAAALATPVNPHATTSSTCV